MSLAKRLFQIMLLAYPREFRLAYGMEMTQVFRDCYRDIQSDGFTSGIAFWLRMILDVIRTAPLERWEALGRRYKLMKNLKSNVIGLVVCVAIIAVTLVLFDYARRHNVALIGIIGYSLDAIICAGILSTLIIFPLVMVRRVFAFRTVLWILLFVHGGLLLLAILIGIRVGFNFPAVLVSYVVSFAFWLTIHWLLSQIRTQPLPS
jgi:hypothetical protein